MVTDCFTASNTFKCSLHKNTGSGKAADYIIAPSHVSFSVLPVAAPSGAVRYLRRSSLPWLAVSTLLVNTKEIRKVRYNVFHLLRIAFSISTG